jgi:hypothetical protein
MTNTEEETVLMVTEAILRTAGSRGAAIALTQDILDFLSDDNKAALELDFADEPEPRVYRLADHREKLQQSFARILALLQSS